MRPLQQLLHVREAALDLAVARHVPGRGVRERLLDLRRRRSRSSARCRSVSCSAMYAESSLAEPEASAFVSAISVSVANWPTLELIWRSPSRGRPSPRARPAPTRGPA